MKVINYKYGYVPGFDCVMDGRIIITYLDLVRVKKILMDWEPEPSYKYLKKLALNSLPSTFPKHQRFNLRTSGTEHVVNSIPHEGKLKKGNYFMEVV